MTDPTPALDPSRTALLVMDYQNGIVGRLEDSEALLGRMAHAIALVRQAGGHIGYVRVAFDDADFDGDPADQQVRRPGRAERADHARRLARHRGARIGGPRAR